MATAPDLEERSAAARATAPWPRNAWYVACMPDEIEGKPLGRTICGEPMVFFRGKEGKVAALEDFCPHRARRCRSGSSAMARWSAAITGSPWAAMARPRACPDSVSAVSRRSAPFR